MRAIIALLTIALAGCAEVLPIGPVPVVDEARDDLFVLAIRAPTGPGSR